MPPKSPSPEDSEILSFDSTEISLIPLRSWRQAQQSSAKGIGIYPAVVEYSAIEQNPARVTIETPSREVSEILNPDATGTSLIPLRSWRQAQQPPANRIGIRQAVVEQSAIE